ncbi:MAG TPA: hypothetical protein DCL41_03440 [Bdellovibrionales bacterium]|nr:hypothetical protein [Pseudobdellovibrionaceae bacterium]HAG90894.1 hypothetical protein [Bdellovibrionales bacterium]|tara:strand:+ start:326 stop:673 length:348 start_codon:yes stop_codon:yes gene_type:complete
MNRHIEVNWSEETPDPTLVDFLERFQENRKKELSDYKTHLENQDFQSLQKLGHNWKGFSRPYGYVALEKMGKTLEQFAKNSDLQGCQEIFEEFLLYINEKELRLAQESSQGPFVD